MHPPCERMQLVQQLLHLLAERLVVVGEPDDSVPVDPDRMDVDVSTREALRGRNPVTLSASVGSAMHGHSSPVV